MKLQEFLLMAEELETTAATAFATCFDDALLEQLRIQFLGAQHGAIKELSGKLAELHQDDRPKAGKRFQEVRKLVTDAFQEAQLRPAKKVLVKVDSPTWHSEDRHGLDIKGSDEFVRIAVPLDGGYLQLMEVRGTNIKFSSRYVRRTAHE